MTERHSHHGPVAQENGGTIFTCPMHPEVQQTASGRCPECGMKLVPQGHGRGNVQPHAPTTSTHASDKHAGHSLRVFARKFWISAVLTIPVVLSSELAERLFGRHLVPVVLDVSFLPLLFASVVFFYGGWVFLVGALREVRGKSPGMMTLIALAISTAYAYSVAVTIQGEGEALFWELTTLITVMLLGHWMEMRAVQGAQGALKALSKLLPDTAEVVRGEATAVVPLEALRVGDVVRVRPGGKIPADGVVADGTSDVNEALVTGESVPVRKGSGGEVIAGSINGDGVLHVRVTRIGEHTFLAGIMRLVAEAQASKSRLHLLSDRAAFALTVIALVSGGSTLVVWVAARAGLAIAIERMVAVLVIACPHALGLAVPLVASISTSLAARNGVLIRRRLALETARSVDTVLFDKTGTLTKGSFGVERVWALGGRNETEVVQVAASVDARSEHVIAKAIVEEAKKRSVPLLAVSGATAVPGQGMRGVLDGQPVAVGGLSMLSEGERIPAELEENAAAASKEGKSVVLVWRGGQLIGGMALHDVVRDESLEAVRQLKAQGIRVAMVTGDSDGVARSVAKELGISEFFARVPPQEKAAKVKLLQAQGRRVAFVGDGINDAPALTQADVGIAIGAGTNVAIESAGILLVRNDPKDIVTVLKLSRATYRKMTQNLFWAAGYNIVALPLAAGVLASRGVVLTPAVSALFMSLSTVIVAVNAMLLRRIRLRYA